MLSQIGHGSVQESYSSISSSFLTGVAPRQSGCAPFPSPQDWRDHWIYQILVDRFNNPEAAPRFSWDGAHGVFQGGTFNGLRQQLDYLEDLGVGAIWLSPVLKNCQYNPCSYHGYGIQDFSAIEPRFTSDPEKARGNLHLAETELRVFVDEAHARGMYVIFDIVLSHAGDVFAYEGHGSVAPWRDEPYPVFWRDEHGQGRAEWMEPPAYPPADAAIWPSELRCNTFFRRRGNAFTRPYTEQENGGDFWSLKGLATDFRLPQSNSYPVRAFLIRAYQSLIVHYDVDGFRIDSLKHIEPEFARVFGNAIREFALSIGKKNFFTFGEVYDSEEKIAAYIGHNACRDDGDLVGVDAALDFPLFYKLPGVVKGFLPSSEVIATFEHRKQVERGILSSNGEATRFFVTFLDNHDQHQRFYYRDPDNPQQFDAQVTLGLGCLFSLQGIPCLYYGTEQGLHGAGRSPEAVREALWGKANAFDRRHPFYQTIQQLAALRRSQPALRYGRQYFRPLSGDGIHFGISHFPMGVLAFSRILHDQEALVVANTNTQAPWRGEVIVDYALNPEGSTFHALFSNRSDLQVIIPGRAVEKAAGRVEIHEVNGAVTRGPARTLPVHLQPMEIQILGKAG